VRSAALVQGATARATDLHRAAANRTELLADREREVLVLLSQGLSNHEIAERLFLVEGTVKGYVTAILRKLGARNRVEAALLAYRAGLHR
jgi:DNA-binding NarL/FixJ family response regulator